MPSQNNWRTQAQCRGLAWLMDPPPELAAINQPIAKSYCHRRCPVVNDCLHWALTLTDTTDPGGVAGGRTAHERKQIRNLVHILKQAIPRRPESEPPHEQRRDRQAA